MPRKQPIKPRDPNLDNPAVRLYRDVIHLQLNHIQREIVASEVTNVRLWEATLIEWMAEGKPPKNVLSILRVYRNMLNGG